MFARYYQTELAYLRDRGAEFARKHPALAGMLAERGVDPDVERLLEGFAFVAARLRQRVDDSYPELVEPLCELLFPHLLRPTPACTMLEFQPSARALRGRTRVEAGRRVQSRSVAGTPCTFATTRALDILPLQLLASRVDETTASRPTLTLDFELESGAGAAVFVAAPLRLHLHGESATSTQLYLWFCRHLRGATLHVGERSMELSREQIMPVGWARDDTLVPWPAFSPHGVRTLVEYFTLPSKFLFVDVHGLDAAQGCTETRFKLVFHFNAPPALPTRLPSDAVRLHCVPATNLFSVDAEPVRRGPGARPTLLRAAGLDPSANEVFAVRSVTGVSRTGRRRAYEPLHTFRHMQRAEPGTSLYALSRQAAPVDDGVHTYLSTRAGDVRDDDEEVLSIELLCTNRSLPSELQIGDVATPTADIPPGIRVRNIARVSPPGRPPLGDALPWAMLSHLACTRRSLSDAEVLRALLALYSAPESHDPISRANRARIAAIRSVAASTITRVLGGLAACGSFYQVELDERAFPGAGDAFLFGTVLHKLLEADARVNTFADLELRLVPSERSYRFQAELAR